MRIFTLLIALVMAGCSQNQPKQPVVELPAKWTELQSPRYTTSLCEFEKDGFKYVVLFSYTSHSPSMVLLSKTEVTK